MMFGSLFSGIGGLDLGLERAGMTCAWQVEINPYCQRILKKHWPNATLYSDIKDLAEHPETLAQVDVIAGGFPCQPFSVAGLRREMEDERWLWPQFFRVVRALRPRYVIVENVPGLLVRGLGSVLGDLASAGYDAEWRCVSAAQVGAWHKRDRVFVVAYSDSGRRKESRKVRGWQSIPDNSGQGLLLHPDSQRCEEQWTGGKPGFPLQLGGGCDESLPHSHGQRQRQPQGIEPHEWGRLEYGSEEVVANPQVQATRRRSIGECQTLSGARFGDGRLPQPTLGASTNGLPGGLVGRGAVFSRPPADTGLWPVGWDEGVSPVVAPKSVKHRIAKLEAIGNAVVPQVAEYVGRMVMEHAGRVE